MIRKQCIFQSVCGRTNAAPSPLNNPRCHLQDGSGFSPTPTYAFPSLHSTRLLLSPSPSSIWLMTRTIMMMSGTTLLLHDDLGTQASFNFGLFCLSGRARGMVVVDWRRYSKHHLRVFLFGLPLQLFSVCILEECPCRMLAMSTVYLSWHCVTCAVAEFAVDGTVLLSLAIFPRATSTLASLTHRPRSRVFLTRSWLREASYGVCAAKYSMQSVERQ